MEARTKFDPIGVVEEAYTFDRDIDGWLEAVTTRAADFFPGRVRMLSLVGEMTDQFELQSVYSEQPEKDADGVDGFFAALEHLPPEVQAAYQSSGTSLKTLSSMLGRAPADHEVVARVVPDDVGDFVGVVSRGPSGLGVQIGAVMPDVTEVNTSDIELWNCISSHIITGFRLFDRLESSVLDGSDAILDPSGSLEHAGSDREKRPAIREALCDAAVSVDRARRDLRGEDAAHALALWKGLVRGTYSLVEYFDTDGRRYYVARRNDPEVESPKALSKRERQVVGYAALGYNDARIAYELGLSASTIATYLRRARRKLSVETRLDLVRLVRSILESAGNGDEGMHS